MLDAASELEKFADKVFLGGLDVDATIGPEPSESETLHITGLGMVGLSSVEAVPVPEADSSRPEDELLGNLGGLAVRFVPLSSTKFPSEPFTC